MTTTEAPATACHFIGIDPSLTGTGLCVLEAGGGVKLKTIATTAKTYPTKYHRIKNIVAEILDTVKALDKGDFRICIERPFVNPKNMNSQQDIIALAYCIREKLYWSGHTWQEVAPTTLKKFVCGSGGAEKSMMLMRVYQNWGISAHNDNEADAVGLAFIAKAVNVIKEGKDRSGWHGYQLDIARKVLAGE